MEEPPVGFTWTGGYVGVQAGYVWGEGDVSATLVSPNVFFPDYSSDPKPDGFLGGFYAGYNQQLSNNVVLGAEADVFWSNADGEDIVDVVGFPVIPNDRWEQEIRWGGAVRARLGYAMDRLMPYLAAGVAFARVDNTERFDDAVLQEFSETHVGWTIGGGAEYAVTDNILLRAEYRYSDYGTENYIINDTFSEDTELTTHDVRLGLAYKF